jgi:hypothetical protein
MKYRDSWDVFHFRRWMSDDEKRVNVRSVPAFIVYYLYPDTSPPTQTVFK